MSHSERNHQVSSLFLYPWARGWTRLFILFFFASFLGACRSMVPLDALNEPVADIAPAWVESSQHVSSEREVLVQWWQQFEDPLLNAWVALALEENREVKMAWARLREAQAITRATRTVRWPSLDFYLSAERSRSASRNNNSGDAGDSAASLDTDVDVGFRGDWDLDVFGQNRQRISGAVAQASVRQAQVQATVLATISAVVQQYYQYRGLQKRILTTEQNTALLKESLDLIQARQRVGEASSFDVSRARGEYQFSGARLPQLRGALRASEHALALLLGKPPGAIRVNLEVPELLPTNRPVVPLGARAELLMRRPDFLVAHAELSVALADYGVAVADLFPKLTLGTLLGFSHGDLDGLVSSNNQRWSAGIFLDWSIFQLRTRQHVRQAASEALSVARYRYEQVALAGLAEVESAIALYDAALNAQVRMASVVSSRQSSHRLARDLYEAGEADYFAVIDAERELVARRDDLIVAETNALLALVDLYVALGGGWQDVGAAEVAK